MRITEKELSAWESMFKQGVNVLDFDDVSRLIKEVRLLWWEKQEKGPEL